LTDLEALKVRLKNVDTTAICDADKTTRVMSAEIRCRSANPGIFGRAFTVRCREDFFAVARAVEEAPVGHVIVIDGGGSETALAGELFARAAIVRGLAGIIVDGGYRDIAYVSQSSLPVYSRYVKPMAGTTSKLGELQVPVTCGGVTVLPGDLVIADVEGIVVVNPDHAERLLRAAENVKANEAHVIARLDSGLPLSAGLNIEEHAERLRSGEPSTLQFLG
jgi:4-hydroxy-4-methyl-2-oxoglutarate aldolase